MKRCPDCCRIYDHRAAVCQVDGTTLDDLNADPLVGQTISKRYRVVRKLGGGSLGPVYLAEELATGNNVAVKFLLKELHWDAELVKQCWWDARLWETASGVAQTGLIAPEYTAPEQLKGDNVADRADIYTLGAVLYAMLTGSAPSTDARHGAEEAGDHRAAPAPLRRMRPEIPAALEQFVMRAIEPRPEDRQSGMEQCLETLRNLTKSVVAGTATDVRAVIAWSHSLLSP